MEQTQLHAQVKRMRGGLIVSNLPRSGGNSEDDHEQHNHETVAEAVRARFREAAAKAEAAASSQQRQGRPSVSTASTLDVHVDVRRGGFAFVTPLCPKDTPPPPWQSELERVLCSDGLDLGEHHCPVKRRRPPKRERIAEQRRRAEAKREAAQRAKARRPAWRPEVMLPRFPSRRSCLDQHVQVADLDPGLLDLVERTYLPFVFPPSCREEVVSALRHVWSNHPNSLRIKELLETLETFQLIEQQIARVRRKQFEAVRTVWDLACGHGLLGVILAYRFADLTVMCVDLERRPCFDHYVDAFRLHGKPDEARGETLPLSNLTFVEGDISSVSDSIDSRSFVASIHGCNEASKEVLDLAQRAGAGYAVMPCCIRDRLYTVRSVSHTEDATRYAIMVGVLAGTYGAHWVAAIDKQITNKNLILFGGYHPVT